MQSFRRPIVRKRVSIGNLSVGGGTSAPSIDTYWYHRYSAVPTYPVEVVAVGKGMIPIFGTMHHDHSEYANRQTYARNFQTANGNCKIVLSQSFWSLTAQAADCFDIDKWTANLSTRITGTAGSIYTAINVEPDAGYCPELFALIGTAASAEQAILCRAWIAAQTKFDFALPDLRLPTMPAAVALPTNSMYNMLPLLGTTQINEWTYAPTGRDFSGVNGEDIIGLRISVDGSAGNYTPEAAKLAWAGRKRMYFPTHTAAATTSALKAAEELEMINRL